jgi:AAA domain
VKAFLKGPPGSGKTYLAAAATGIWKTLYIDVEGGAFSAFPIVKKENIVIRVIRESDSKDFFDKVADAIEEGETGQYECVVLDSLTEISGRMEDDYGNKSASGKLDFGEWYELMRRIRNLCKRVKDMKCHSIITSLTKPMKEEAGTTIYEPVLAGQLSTVIPSYFDTVGLLRKTSDKSGVKYIMTTDGPSIYQVRDRYRALTAEEPVHPQDGWKIWKKLADGITKMSSTPEAKKEKEVARAGK